MAVSYKNRRRWSLVILLLGLPLYIMAAVFCIDLLERPPLWLETVIYIVLGVLWALPFRFIFRGVGKENPDA